MAVSSPVFKHPKSIFIIAKKTKGTEFVDVTLSTGLENYAQDLLLLETVSATGDTLIEVARKINFICPEVKVSALVCYASPQAIEKTASSNCLTNLIVGIQSEGVDPAGWLLPKIRGDAGDKLFGDAKIFQFNINV